MKIFLMCLSLLSAAAPAFSAAPPLAGMIQCDSNSTEHNFDVKIYNRAGRYFGQLYFAQYNGETEIDNDGNEELKVVARGEDVVELEVVTDDETGTRFRQKDGVRNADRELDLIYVRSNNVSRGVEVFIPRETGRRTYASTVTAKVGPLGYAASNKLKCW